MDLLPHEQWMSERVAFACSVFGAEVLSSAVLHLFYGGTPVAQPLSVLVYGWEHLLTTTCIWAVFFPLSWMLGPSRWWRRRVRLATRMKMLWQFGLVALVVDALSTFNSIFLETAEQTSPEAIHAMWRGLGVRELIWVAVYAGLVAFFFFFGSRFPEKDVYMGQDVID